MQLLPKQWRFIELPNMQHNSQDKGSNIIATFDGQKRENCNTSVPIDFLRLTLQTAWVRMMAWS